MQRKEIRILNAWIKELRSGKYKQSSQYLRELYLSNNVEEYRYSALGILVVTRGFRFRPPTFQRASEDSPGLVKNYIYIPPIWITNDLYLGDSLLNVLGERKEEFLSISRKHLSTDINKLKGEESVSRFIVFHTLYSVSFEDTAEFIEKFHIPYVEKRLKENE